MKQDSLSAPTHQIGHCPVPGGPQGRPTRHSALSPAFFSQMRVYVHLFPVNAGVSVEIDSYTRTPYAGWVASRWPETGVAPGLVGSKLDGGLLLLHRVWVVSCIEH